jgi:hypothetical protein
MGLNGLRRPRGGCYFSRSLAIVCSCLDRGLPAGADGVQEPVRKEDEDRRGGFRDSGGTTWWVATREG